jgi:glutathione S-transferase
MASPLALYELQGIGGRHYSLFSWRTRWALAHKGLAFESRGVNVSDKAAIAFSGQGRVPILVDGDTTVFDSWRIAEHLEGRSPDAPSLFGGAGGRQLARFFNAWVDRSVLPALAPNVALRIVECVEPADAAHLRAGFEKAFGKTLEAMFEGRDKGLERFARVLDPLRAHLKTQPFVGGSAPLYADYIAASPLQWARVTCPEPVLGADDPLRAWFDRVLDLHGGFGRNEPARA